MKTERFFETEQPLRKGKKGLVRKTRLKDGSVRDRVKKEKALQNPHKDLELSRDVDDDLAPFE